MFDMAEIDRQHRELVNMLNRLNDAVKNYESRNDIYRLIDEVISYTRLHFATEELLMVQSGFPEIESHKRMHAELIKDTLHLKDKLDYVGEDMFSDWFNHWPFGRVLAHIQYGDKQIGDHIYQYDSGLPRRIVPDQFKHA
ncbi:MAG: Hemerythrin-like metal-binding protein [Candidatus Gallionella acididurans]|uniref:Hemerythrin-like metal-binding protein n=1 Tax=Candidatus Gallionella acididurans TaxID=1796491 RepID=A0A139BWN9_9PROT|nr:MAG: Hemerythrin-like metal-binding protein [Candidatus Gallionella acididurans]